MQILPLCRVPGNREPGPETADQETLDPEKVSTNHKAEEAKIWGCPLKTSVYPICAPHRRQSLSLGQGPHDTKNRVGA